MKRYDGGNSLNDRAFRYFCIYPYMAWGIVRTTFDMLLNIRKHAHAAQKLGKIQTRTLRELFPDATRDNRPFN